MSTYLDTYNKYDCNGCSACSLICPQKCIEMVEDNEGFIYPYIDEKKCINCNLCRNKCRLLINTESNKIKFYAGYNLDENDRLKSSSGAIFPLLAKHVINNNGIVFGAYYDEHMNVRHGFADTLEDCKKFKGSKYVRSNIIGIFQKVKEFLDSDRFVLFTGTPCQVNGLNIFLNKKYDKLVRCDIICHSNPSPKVLRKYINSITKKYKSNVIDLEFRNKKNGWRKYNPTIVLEKKNKSIYDHLYLNAFGNGIISRPSCYKCEFTSTNRASDITIADFWGVDKFNPELDDNKGTSLIIVNTEFGQKIFNKISKSLKYVEIDSEKAFKYNHNKPVLMNPNRQKLFNKIDDPNFIKYLKKYTYGPLPKMILRKIIPNNIKDLLRKLLLYKKGTVIEEDLEKQHEI